jgi:sigma-54-specific transcriptional regulator
MTTTQNSHEATARLLSFPAQAGHVLSIRAKALLFSDPRSLALLRQIEQVANGLVSVLIQGESGTGKELVAMYLHELSGRPGPFVAVNCGAFSEALVEAELFGHEAGAFTGAHRARAGWFEAAHGGTLFLDEIGDLPLAMQVKLLRVLQEREVVRIGSRTPVPVDVRLITATNIDLCRAVSVGNFRVDLFYRINVASLHIPPLRERPGDITPLVHHFARTHAERQGVLAPEVSPAALHALLHYSWPGNIRELENVMQFASLVCRNSLIEPMDLRFVPTCAPNQRFAVQQTPQEAFADALDRLIDEEPPGLFDYIEQTVIERAFSLNGENQVRTADALGISRNVLRTLMKRHGLLPA